MYDRRAGCTTGANTLQHSPPSLLEWEAHGNDPAVVVLVKLRHRDLYAGAKDEVESLRKWKRTQDESGRQEGLFSSVQDAARPKRRILLKRGPDFPLDLIIDLGIEDDRPAEEICSASWEVCANRALNIPLADALSGRESGRQDRMTEAVRRSTCGKRATEEKSYEIVALALRR